MGRFRSIAGVVNPPELKKYQHGPGANPKAPSRTGSRAQSRTRVVWPQLATLDREAG